jgi:dihydrolipoamide dehydrogenase
VLAKAARLMRDSEQLADYGLIAEKPRLDFRRLISRTQHVVYSIHEKKQLIGHLERSGVQVHSEIGPVRFTDSHTVEWGSGYRLTADKFLLCAGGRARRLDFPGAEFALTHSDIWRLKDFPRSLIVVGGAATGCQLASIFQTLGSQVAILEIASRILRLEDLAISDVIGAQFAKQGMQIITGFEKITRLENVDGANKLFFDLSGEELSLKADAVVLSTGWVGNLSSLHLPAAGVETVGNYVRVDDSLRTSIPHIFAAGDITGRMMLVQSAGYEAIVAAENAVLEGNRPSNDQIVPHGGFTDPEYGSVGLTEEQAIKAHDCVIATVPYSDTDRAVIDGHTVGHCKLIVSRDTHRVLGAHVVGEQALEIVHLIASGMTADMWVEQLAELQIAYPTFTAVVGLAARRIVRDLGVRPLAPEWRSISRPLAAEWERRD